MKKALFIYFLVLVVSTLSAQEKISSKEWQEDLRFLQEKIHKDYAFLFVKLDKDDFDAEVEALYNDIPNMQDHEVRVGLSRIVAQFKYGHTQIHYSTVARNGILPINLYQFNEDIYIEGVQKEHKKALGAKVLKIEATPIGKALDLIYPVVPVENENYFKAYGLRFLISPEVLHAQRVVPELSDTITFTLEKEGKVFTYEFPTIELKEKPRTFNFTLPTEEWLTARNTETTPLYLKHLEDSKVLYVRQSSVFDDPSETLKQFYERLFQFIDTHDVERLVYDVRLNGGGNNYNNLPLIKGLMARPQINKKGSFYYIIGRETFSACQNLTNEIVRYTDAILIGEPTSENVNFYGDARPVELPKSKIVASLSYLWWQDVPALENSDWTTPNVSADMTFDAYVNNEDPILDVALSFDAEGFIIKPINHIVDLFLEGDVPKMVKELSEMMQDPRYSTTDFEVELNKLGNMLLQSGREPQVQMSTQMFSMIAQYFPESALTHKNLGHAYLQLGDTEKAKELLNKSIALDKHGKLTKSTNALLSEIGN